MPSSVNLIVLIGYRGAGKSLLAKKLSKKLGWKYISSDDEIERTTGEAISTWVPQRGWEAFRKIEHRVCQGLCDQEEAVIDLGGGAVENPDNLKGFVENPRALIFWIDASLETLIARLQSDHPRPLLNSPSLSTEDRHAALVNETQTKYRERRPLYQKFSHHLIANDKSSSVAMNRILRFLKTKHTVKNN